SSRLKSLRLHRIFMPRIARYPLHYEQQKRRFNLQSFSSFQRMRAASLEHALEEQRAGSVGSSKGKRANRRKPNYGSRFALTELRKRSAPMLESMVLSLRYRPLVQQVVMRSVMQLTLFEAGKRPLY